LATDVKQQAQRSDRCLQLVGPWSSQSHRAVENGARLGDRGSVPQAPVLVLKGHQLAVGIDPSDSS
jgi:hypothetical protein